MTDEPDDQESDPSPDDLLEATRHGSRFVGRPQTIGPAIGSNQVVREDIPNAEPVRVVYQLPNGKLVAAWHDGAVPLTAEQWAAVGVPYAEFMERAQHATRHDKWMEWGPDEWRQIPGFPSYEQNGWTREVRRREKTLKNGTVKPPKIVTARKSSVTLSQDGVVSSRGIEKLWRSTFPEYVVNDNSWQVQMLRREAIPEGLGRVVKTGW